MRIDSRNRETARRLLKVAMVQRGLSCCSLARILGIAPSTVSKIISAPHRWIRAVRRIELAIGQPVVTDIAGWSRHRRAAEVLGNDPLLLTRAQIMAWLKQRGICGGSKRKGDLIDLVIRETEKPRELSISNHSKLAKTIS